jgi:hypothetical protein
LPLEIRLGGIHVSPERRIRATGERCHIRIAGGEISLLGDLARRLGAGASEDARRHPDLPQASRAHGHDHRTSAHAAQ